MLTSTRLVELTRSPHALRVAASLPDLRETAAGNARLPKALWLEQYRTKPALKIALALAGLPLDDEQVTHLFTTETRTKVLTTAVEGPARISRENLTLLTSNKGFTAALAEKVIDKRGRSVDLAWLKAAADAGGKARMEYFLRAGDTLTDAEIGTVLLDYDSWGDKWDNARRAQLLAARPGLLPYAARSNSHRLRTAAAGCRHLTDPDLQRQVADLTDPVTADPKQLPRQFVDDRAFTWVALACNPACDLTVVAELDPLLAQVSDYENQQRAKSRLDRQPYRLSGPLEDEADLRVIEWVTRRTLPSCGYDGRTRDRRQDLAALLRNKHLTVDLAGRMFAALGQHRWLLWEDPDVLAAFTDLTAAWPEQAAEHGWTPAEVAELHEQPGTTGPAPVVADGPHPAWQLDPYDAGAWDARAAEARNQAGGHSERQVQYWFDVRDGNIALSTAIDDSAARQVAVLDENVVEDTEAWLMVFRMLEQSFGGTARELVTIANAVAN